MDKKSLDSKWKNIQANMALEGHFISDELLEKAASEYQDENLDEEMDAALLLSKQSGRPLLEILKELHQKKLK